MFGGEREREREREGLGVLGVGVSVCEILSLTTKDKRITTNFYLPHAIF